MSRYPLGQPVIIGDPAAGYLTFTDAISGALVDPTTITTTLLKPDQSTVPYTAPTKVTGGTYYQALPAGDLTLPGPYQWKTVSTGPGAGTVHGSFTVYDPFDFELLSVQDAKEQLEKIGPVDDAELELYVTAVTRMIEGKVGPCSRQTITETVYGGRVLQLSRVPVVSVTSITGIYLGTPTYVTTGLAVDPWTGIIRQPAGFTWAGPLTVVYVAGRTDLPADLALAGRLLLQHLWRTKRAQSASPQFGGPTIDEGLPVGAGYAWPNRVRELIEPHKLPPALA